jgi:hypothetical protein
MLGGRLDFLRHFVFFCSNLFFYFFLWFQLPKYIIRFTLNSIASGMTIAIILSTPLLYTEFFLNFFFPLKFSSYYRQDFHQIRKSHLFYLIFYRLSRWKWPIFTSFTLTTTAKRLTALSHVSTLSKRHGTLAKIYKSTSSFLHWSFKTCQKNKKILIGVWIFIM